MSISIKGVKLGNLDIKRDKETGVFKLEGSYELISNTDIVLAKQSFNGYSDIKLTESSETLELKNKLLASITTDLNRTLGMG